MMRKRNSDLDPFRGAAHGHGERAAESVATLREERIVSLSDEEAELLAYACLRHSDGLLDADVTVQTGWDADRLDLGRVGRRADPRRLCTPAARDRAVLEWAYQRSVLG